MKIIIPGDPVAMGRPKFTVQHGYAQAYTPAKSREYKKRIEVCALEAKQMDQFWKESKPLTCYFSVEIEIFRDIPSSWKNLDKNKALNALLRPGKPDLDNYAKTILDGLNGIFWVDDAQVVALTVSKWYDISARAEVTIKTIRIN